MSPVCECVSVCVSLLDYVFHANVATLEERITFKGSVLWIYGQMLNFFLFPSPCCIVTIFVIVMVGEISHHHHSSSLLHPWLRSRSLSTSSAASSFMYYGTYVIYCNQMSLIVAASRGRAREESFAITSEEKHRWKTVGNTGFEWEFRANFTAFTMSEGW